MLQAPSIAAALPLERARGQGRIAAKLRDGASVLDTVYQKGCAKIRVPRTHGPGLQAVLINSSGGLTGGDRMDWAVAAGAGTYLTVTTQACERIYRALAGKAEIETRISVDAGARIDWLPQETILFEGAALERTLEVDLAGNACFLGLEAVILGREAMGEDARAAALADTWRIRREGRLIHAEAARLDAGCALSRGNIALLDNARAFAALCYAGPDAGRRLDAVKALLAPHEGAGASGLGEKLVVRALARSGYHLRRMLMPVIAALAADNAVPRLWTL